MNDAAENLHVIMRAGALAEVETLNSSSFFFVQGGLLDGFLTALGHPFMQAADFVSMKELAGCGRLRPQVEYWTDSGRGRCSRFIWHPSYMFRA